MGQRVRRPRKLWKTSAEGIGGAIVGGIKLLFGKKETGEEVWSNFGENLVKTVGAIDIAIIRSAQASSPG